MTISKIVQDAINDQIKNELTSAYLYLSMSAYFQTINLPGFAHWMRVQHAEELGHAMKFYDYLFDRSGQAVVPSIEKPTTDFKSPLDVFQKYLDHEQKVSASIHKLYEIVTKENDYPSQVMLQWFITEQVEEEKTGMDVVEQLKMIGDNRSALLYMNKQLGVRAAAKS